jgi:hypothetical protein
MKLVKDAHQTKIAKTLRMWMVVCIPNKTRTR